jgi:hypothetical protein
MALAFSLAGQGLLASAVLDGNAAWLQASDSLAMTLLVIALALLVPRTSGAQRTVCVLIVLACAGLPDRLGHAAGALRRRPDGAGRRPLARPRRLGRPCPAPGTSSRSPMGLTFAALCLAPYGGAYLGEVEATLLGAARECLSALLYAAGTSLVWLATVSPG